MVSSYFLPNTKSAPCCSIFIALIVAWCILLWKRLSSGTADICESIEYTKKRCSYNFEIAREFETLHRKENVILWNLNLIYGFGLAGILWTTNGPSCGFSEKLWVLLPNGWLNDHFINNFIFTYIFFFKNFSSIMKIWVFLRADNLKNYQRIQTWHKFSRKWKKF